MGRVPSRLDYELTCDVALALAADLGAQARAVDGGDAAFEVAKDELACGLSCAGRHLEQLRAFECDAAALRAGVARFADLEALKDAERLVDGGATSGHKARWCLDLGRCPGPFTAREATPRG